MREAPFVLFHAGKLIVVSYFGWTFNQCVVSPVGASTVAPPEASHIGVPYLPLQEGAGWLDLVGLGVHRTSRLLRVAAC